MAVVGGDSTASENAEDEFRKVTLDSDRARTRALKRTLAAGIVGMHQLPADTDERAALLIFAAERQIACLPRPKG